MPRKPRYILGSVFVVLIGIAIWVYACIGNPLDPFDDKRFDAQIWATANKEDRSRMCEDLINNHLPAGTTEAQVLTMLGKPEGTSTGQSYGRMKIGTYHYRYWLGDWSMHGMDAAYFDIHFDEQRRVVGAEIFGT